MCVPKKKTRTCRLCVRLCRYTGSHYNGLFYATKHFQRTLHVQTGIGTFEVPPGRKDAIEGRNAVRPRFLCDESVVLSTTPGPHDSVVPSRSGHCSPL